ncbi:histidine phosphatase family protein [Neobacillus sp. PS3-34]|nr:histidine phosphatase family protein [Neobacillus sp. PS3-34]WML50577.1 histidine phosphatase family protein [Neobacillus sp. PS3-34]
MQDGESELEFRFRAERVLHKLLFDYPGYSRIAVVSHGGLISNFLKAFLKQPNTSEFGYWTGDTGMHLLEVRDNLRLLKFLNKQDHLL